ncbi:MAG: hypothetical protein K2K70_01600 [Lachnospiraceae bacterium]|nr:hypothetical protein [Lachnospiraceae bacterium]
MMDVSATNSVSSAYTNATQEKKSSENTAAANAEDKAKKEEEAVVFEKSKEKKKASTNQIYNKDAVVAKLKADQQSRLDSLQSLVSKLLNKQGSTFDLANGNGLAAKFREAAKNADPATIKAAKDSISEDGYWGVNQTSDRLVSMAIALSGGDTDKADEMMAAIEKGYKQATRAWGEKLPQICQDTMEATRQKMNDWKNGTTSAADYSNYLS